VAKGRNNSTNTFIKWSHLFMGGSVKPAFDAIPNSSFRPLLFCLSSLIHLFNALTFHLNSTGNNINGNKLPKKMTKIPIQQQQQQNLSFHEFQPPPINPN